VIDREKWVRQMPAGRGVSGALIGVRSTDRLRKWLCRSINRWSSGIAGWVFRVLVGIGVRMGSCGFGLDYRAVGAQAPIDHLGLVDDEALVV